MCSAAGQLALRSAVVSMEAVPPHGTGILTTLQKQPAHVTRCQHCYCRQWLVACSIRLSLNVVQVMRRDVITRNAYRLRHIQPGACFFHQPHVLLCCWSAGTTISCSQYGSSAPTQDRHTNDIAETTSPCHKMSALLLQAVAGSMRHTPQPACVARGEYSTSDPCNTCRLEAY
jgi:hypothetical protein